MFKRHAIDLVLKSDDYADIGCGGKSSFVILEKIVAN